MNTCDSDQAWTTSHCQNQDHPRLTVQNILGSLIEYNEVNEHGSAIFFVSNDHSGNIVIDDSVIVDNIGGSWYPAYDGISMHSDTSIEVTDSIIENNS